MEFQIWRLQMNSLARGHGITDPSPCIEILQSQNREILKRESTSFGEKQDLAKLASVMIDMETRCGAYPTTQEDGSMGIMDTQLPCWMILTEAQYRSLSCLSSCIAIPLKCLLRDRLSIGDRSYFSSRVILIPKNGMPTRGRSIVTPFGAVLI